MAESRRILTVHSPVPPKVLDDLLTAVESALQRVGAGRVWIDARWAPDLAVMAEMSDPRIDGGLCDGVGVTRPTPDPFTPLTY